MVTRRRVTGIYQERLMCDDCGEEVIFSGRTYMTCPAKHVYICQKCKKEIVQVEPLYPRLTYEFEGDNNENS